VKCFSLAPWGLALFVGLSGCATSYDAAWAPARPLGSAVPAYQPPAIQSPDSVADPVSATDSLRLREALGLALMHNPELQVFGWEVRAREAHLLQAGLLPNPQLGTDLENFGGDGPLSDFDGSEVTVGLSQLVEFGGDRRRRRDVAKIERDLAGWDYETVRLDVFTETAQAFATVLAAQERGRLAFNLLNRARRFYEAVEARVEAGKESALAERRAMVVLSNATIQLRIAERGLTAVRSRLSATWGTTVPVFDHVVGNLKQVEPVPVFGQVSEFLEMNPDVARWQAEISLRQAGIALERARRTPNAVFSVGTRRLRDIDQSAFTAGVAITLPLFDRNQGAIQEAKYRAKQAEAARTAAAVRAGRMLVEAYEVLSVASTSAEMLSRDVIPAAEENLSATEQAYREGKFDLLKVLDAQRTLFEATNQYVDVLEAYHISRAEVERLIGTPLTAISNK